MNYIQLIFLSLFIIYLARSYAMRSSSPSLRILGPSFNKIPKHVLELASINSSRELLYEDLDEKQKQRVMKFQRKLESISSCWLTYLDNQNLIHVEREDRSYFMHTDHENRELINMEVGKTSHGEQINFILYRKKRGFLRSPVLVGYLINEGTIFEGKKGKKPEILFEFPENLAKRSFFTAGLENEFTLIKDTVADFHGKNEMQDDETLYVITYKQKDEYDFWLHR